MASTDSEPKPGTAFKKIMEEKAMLDEFMAMVKNKLTWSIQPQPERLDRTKKTWNPKWSNTGVWKLISPMLTYFTEEISHLISAEDGILAHFSAVPKQTFPQEHLPSEFDHLKADHERCGEPRQRTATTDEQDRIAAVRKNVERLGKGEDFYIPFYGLLPPSVRFYRNFVIVQHQCVSLVGEWYDNKLEGILERHQQRTEDIKAFVLGFCRRQGKVVADLSASCSAALHSTQAFASTLFIAPRYEETIQERSHPLLRKFEYRNFFDGRVGIPLFGVDTEQTLMLANLILDTIERPVHFATRRYSEGDIDWVFNIEEWAPTNPDLEAAIRQYDPNYLHLLLKAVVLVSYSPLLWITQVDLDAYRNGVRRKKLHQVVEYMYHDGMKLLPRLWRTFSSISSDNPERTVARLLCYDREVQAMAPIVRDIWRKWDFDANRPLPDGVTREVASPWRVVWTKTGAPYFV